MNWKLLIVLLTMSCSQVEQVDKLQHPTILESCNLTKIHKGEVITIEANYKPISHMIQVENQFKAMDSITYMKFQKKFQNHHFIDLKISGIGRDEFIELLDEEREIFIEEKKAIIQPSMIHHEALMNMTPYRTILLMFSRKSDEIEDIKLLIEKGNRYLEFDFKKADIQSYPQITIKNN